MKLYISIFLTLVVFSIEAQGFRVRHYIPGASTNVTKALFEASPGNYIGGGIVVDSVTGKSQLCMVGLGTQGELLWHKKYGGTQLQYAHNGFTSRSFYKHGNFVYYTGCVLDANNKYLGVLIKFDLNGDTIWQRLYGDNDPLEDVVPQMLTSSVDGGFLITGYFQHSGPNAYRKCMLIKTDINCNELWRQKVGKVTPNVQDGRAILQDSASKKIVIAGYQYIGNSNSWSPFDNVLILDSLGVKLHQVSYTQGTGGFLYDLIQTKDKKMIAVGQRLYSQTVGGTNLIRSFALKFNLDSPASPIWSISFDKLEITNIFMSLVELPDTGILIGGIIDTMTLNDLNTNALIRLTKISQNGIVIWNRYYDYKINSQASNNYLELKSLNLTSDGSIIGAIESLNFPSPNPLFFVKWDSNGCDSTVAYCQAQSTITPVALSKDNLDNIFIRVFPNPTDGLVNIKINDDDYSGDLTVDLTDVTGRLVRSIVSPKGNGIFQADLSKLNAGMYLLSLRKNGQVFYKEKLVKVD